MLPNYDMSVRRNIGSTLGDRPIAQCDETLVLNCELNGEVYFVYASGSYGGRTTP